MDDGTNEPIIQPVEEKIAPFLLCNIGTEYLASDADGGIIRGPWGETGLVLEISSDNNPLVVALNSVLLPARFTAIWHQDTRDFEIIWAPIPDDWDELSRTFEFQFAGQTYRCEFGAASERLLLIAASASQSTGPTGSYTRFPNLNSLDSVVQARTKGALLPFVLTSFWIRDVQWDENAVVELARHLNFYMYYFDHNTPQILIHDPTPPPSSATPPRYPFDSFPPSIAGRQLDPVLLGLWAS